MVQSVESLQMVQNIVEHLNILRVVNYVSIGIVKNLINTGSTLFGVFHSQMLRWMMLQTIAAILFIKVHHKMPLLGVIPLILT